MSSDLLVFLHVLLAMTLLGSLLACTVASMAARRKDSAVLRDVAWKSSLLTLLAALATIALGESVQAEEDLDGAWLDASYGLAYLGLLAGGVVLAVISRLALGRPRLTGAAAGLGALMIAVALAVTFLMTGKPA